MAVRCPHSKPIARARLMNHRFIIMRDGVASVKREPGAVVHGLLWSLSLSDVPPLDAFEEVGAGRYTKVIHPVLKPVGSTRAFLYVGHTTETGPPLPCYLEAVIAAAARVGLPDGYIGSLAAWGRGGSRGQPFDAMATGKAAGPVPGVRARFASPRDRP